MSEWEVYDRLDPIGTWRDDYRLAFVCALLSNLTLSVYGKRGTKMTLPTDFMLEWDLEKKEPKKQSVEEMKKILLGIVDSVNQDTKRTARKYSGNVMTRPPRRFRDKPIIP